MRDDEHRGRLGDVPLLPIVRLVREHARLGTTRARGDHVVDTEKVEQVIEIIRPAVQADGGDVYLRGVDVEKGVVTVELVGACVSCPASTVTLKAGIERIMKDRVPGVTEVVDVGASETETALSL
jgi:Fe-S cluster biogenesis protein NfuA